MLENQLLEINKSSYWLIAINFDVLMPIAALAQHVRASSVAEEHHPSRRCVMSKSSVPYGSEQLHVAHGDGFAMPWVQQLALQSEEHGKVESFVGCV